MMCRDTKITFFNFSPYECWAAEEYLEVMAQKGWMLQSMNGAYLKFKRIEPRKIKYSVDVLEKVSSSDHKDRDIVMEYREYCQAAGWKYICEKGLVQVFCTEFEEKTISIHTDEEEKFRSVFQASLFSMGGKLFSILLFLFYIYLQLFKESADLTLATNIGVLAVVVLFSGILINSIELINFFLWVIKVKWRLKENKYMPYNNYRQLRIKNILKIVYSIITLILLLKFLIFDRQSNFKYSIAILFIMGISTIILICVQRYISKKRCSKENNIAITIGSTVVSVYLAAALIIFIAVWCITPTDQSKAPKENVGLTLMDFGYKKDNAENTNVVFDKSILAQRIWYFSDNQGNTVDYTVFHSQYIWIIEFYENRLLNRMNAYVTNLMLMDTNLPEGIKVYSDSEKKSYVLVSKDRVVDIKNNFKDISEDEFLKVVYRKLLD